MLEDEGVDYEDDFSESDDEDEDSGGKVIVVSGGNRGIGLEVVRRVAMLKKPGDTIYLCSRSVYRLVLYIC